MLILSNSVFSLITISVIYKKKVKEKLHYVWYTKHFIVKLIEVDCWTGPIGVTVKFNNF